MLDLGHSLQTQPNLDLRSASGNPSDSLWLACLTGMANECTFLLTFSSLINVLGSNKPKQSILLCFIAPKVVCEVELSRSRLQPRYNKTLYWESCSEKG